MDLLEARVRVRERLGERPAVVSQRCASSTQSRDRAGTSVHGGGLHPAGEGLDVVLAEAPGASRSVASGCGVTSQTGPERHACTWRTSVIVTSSPSVQSRARAPGRRPTARRRRSPGPPGTPGAPCCRPPALGEQRLDLVEHQRVALDAVELWASWCQIGSRCPRPRPAWGGRPGGRAARRLLRRIRSWMAGREGRPREVDNLFGSTTNQMYRTTFKSVRLGALLMNRTLWRPTAIRPARRPALNACAGPPDERCMLRATSPRCARSCASPCSRPPPPRPPRRSPSSRRSRPSPR